MAIPCAPPRRIAIVVWTAGGLCLATTAGAFTISGTVRNNAAAPVANVNVFLFDDNGNPIGIPPTATNTAGFYSISGIPNGRYALDFEPPTSTRLLVAHVEQVDVNDANVTQNATLQPGFLLSGFVRNGQGTGIADIDLNVENRDTGELLNTPGDNTDVSGFYHVVVPGANLRVTYRDLTPAPPAYLDVTLEFSMSGDRTQNVTMSIGIFVSGTVRRTNGTPVANANLDFIDVATGIKLDTPGDVTNSNGAYSVHIPPATYDVRVKPDPALRLAATEQQSLLINSDRTLDLALLNGWALSGTVRRTGGTPVANVDIDVASPTTGAKLYLPADLTDGNGNYQVFVPNGTWNVTFEPPVATLLVCQQTNGVVMNADNQLSPTLVTGVLVSGTVQRTNGTRVANADIDVRRTANGIEIPLAGDLTDANGAYSTVVPPDTYYVEFQPQPAMSLQGYKTQPISVAGNSTVNATLQPGIQVSGYATDNVGTLLRNTDVNVVVASNGTVLFTPGDKTDLHGHYAIVVPSGTWRFVFTPDPTVIVTSPRTFENVAVSNPKILNVAFPARVTTDAGDRVAPALRILNCAPNPFNPTIRIDFSLDQAGAARLAVFDARGRLVRTLVAATLPAGRHQNTWDGTDAGGRSMPSGAYFCRLESATGAAVAKLVLVR